MFDFVVNHRPQVMCKIKLIYTVYALSIQNLIVTTAIHRFSECRAYGRQISTPNEKKV